MMEADEEDIYPELNFKSIHETIQNSISVINNNQSVMAEKQVSFDILKQKSIELNNQISKSEKIFSQMNSAIYSAMDLFQQEIPKKILCINECENDLQCQLEQLDEEKNRLFSKLQDLNNQFNQMSENIEKINAISQSISLGISASTGTEVLENLDFDQTTDEINNTYSELFQISEDIQNIQHLLYQFESSSIQIHTRYLCEIERINTLKALINAARFSQSNHPLESIRSLELEQSYLKDKINQYHNTISTLQHKQRALNQIELTTDNELQKILSIISTQKEKKAEIKAEYQQVITEINQKQLKRDKFSNKFKLFMGNKLDEFEQLRELKSQTANLLQKERQSILNSNKASQNLLLLQNDIENEEKQIENESFKLDRLENKLKLKEDQIQHIYERSTDEKKRLQAIYFDYKQKISNQEKLYFEITQLRPTIPYETLQYENPIEKELRENLTDIENIKQKVVAALEQKKQEMQEKSDMLSEITSKTSEIIQLKKKKRKKYEKQYYSSISMHHQALVLNEHLNSQIKEKELKINQKKKHIDELNQMLLRIISECDIQNSGGKCVIDVYQNCLEPPKRKIRLDHFIEKYKEIINKVSEITFKVDLQLSDKVLDAILNEWCEFIDKEYDTI